MLLNHWRLPSWKRERGPCEQTGTETQRDDALNALSSTITWDVDPATAELCAGSLSSTVPRDCPLRMLACYLALGVLMSAVLCEQKPFWIEDEAESHVRPLDNSLNPDDDFTTAYPGITTFANLPYVNCLHPRYSDEAKEKFDVAIVGAPFDTTVTYRPG